MRGISKKQLKPDAIPTTCPTEKGGGEKRRAIHSGFTGKGERGRNGSGEKIPEKRRHA